jgi:hypothetical protein
VLFKSRDFTSFLKSLKVFIALILAGNFLKGSVDMFVTLFGYNDVSQPLIKKFCFSSCIMNVCLEIMF